MYQIGGDMDTSQNEEIDINIVVVMVLMKVLLSCGNHSSLMKLPSRNWGFPYAISLRESPTDRMIARRIYNYLFKYG